MAARATPRRGAALVRRRSAHRRHLRLTSASSTPSRPCRASVSSDPARGASCTLPMATGRRPTTIRAGSITMCWWRSTRARGLNTGEPSLWAHHFDRIGVGRASGCCRSAPAAGYFTAILAELVGRNGRVDGIEIDVALCAEAAQRNLEAWPQAWCASADGAADRGPVGRHRRLCRRHPPARLVARRPGRRRPPADADDDRERGGFMLRLDRHGDGLAARSAGWLGFYPCAGARSDRRRGGARRRRSRSCRPAGAASLRRDRTTGTTPAGCTATAGASASASCTEWRGRSNASSASRAAPSRPNGAAAARAAASGTPSSRKPPPAPGPAGGGLARGGKGRLLEFAGLTGSTPQPPRYKSGIVEFDRVCGGGLVVGSALLIGGDPGIGKSTLLLQVAAALATSTPPAPTSPARKRSTRCAARRAAGPGRRAGAAHRRDLGARHRGHARAARRAQGRGDRFHPDHVARHGRQRRRAR